MSSNIVNGGPPPTSQKVVGAIFFILPVAFIVIFLCWCWSRHHRISQEARWAQINFITIIAPHNRPLESLPTPELHSACVQPEDSAVRLRWSDIKVSTHHPICSPSPEFNIIHCHQPVYASFRTDSSEQPESSSGPTAQVGVLIRMPSRESIKPSERAHLRGVILLGLTNSLHVQD